MSSQIDMTRPSDADVQDMLVRAVKQYAARVEENGALAAFPSEQSVSATEVMVTVTAMLKAVNLQLFELGMWQSWAGK
jgi:hypothetical protein